MAIRMGEGPVPARIMLVGECYNNEQEDNAGKPFMEGAGAELDRLLHEAGIMRSECYCTNVVNARPPFNDITRWIAVKKKDITAGHVPLKDKFVLPIVREGYESLIREIGLVQPNLIIALGNLPMWVLTGMWGVLKWRGSMLETEGGIKVIPTLPPSGIFKDWSSRPLVVTDLRRAKREAPTKTYTKPDWHFIIRPNLDTVQTILLKLIQDMDGGSKLWLDLDIETRAGHIACIGLSWSSLDALVIPLMCLENDEGYWGIEEEVEIVWMLRRLFTHPNAQVRWQNGLYDAQYIWRWWMFLPRGVQDTMISQHSLFAALPKGLGFLGSMYAPWYVYWKDEGKTWAGGQGEDQLWSYNAQDCIYTRVIGEVLAESAAKMQMQEVESFQQSLFWPVLHSMLRGVRVIPEAKAKMALDIQEAISEREAFLNEVLGLPLNINSPKQMCALFYEDLAQPAIKKRSQTPFGYEMRPTCDDEALMEIGRREPLLRPVCNAIADLRTLGKFLKDFVMMRLDTDGRMRCSFNIAGDAGGKSAPYSYRLSSSENAFGSGGNLQTIPSEKSKSSGKAAARGSLDFALPNIRSMYGPDPGHTFFDMDLDRADLQVVVWESNDEMLKTAMRMGADIHLLNVFSLDGQDPPPLEELVESHPRYMDHRGPRKHKREFAKVFCHATNYLGKAKTVAAHTGRLIHDIERSQARWFAAHPGILAWHTRVIEQVKRHRFVENRFGYRWHIFDRINEQLYPKCVAWIPQSTVGGVINRVWLNFYNNLPEVHVLLQVHDSLCGQFPTHLKEKLIPLMKKNAEIVIPYEEPLIIPVGIKTSEVSWGDCI